MPLYKYARKLGDGENSNAGSSGCPDRPAQRLSGLRRRALAEIPFSRLSESFDFDIEVIAAARARGLAVGEAPIPTRYADEISHLNP